MTFHAEYTLRSSSVFEVLDLLFAVPALEACCAKGLVPGENGKVLNFVVTDAAAVCTIVADKGAVAE